MFLFVTRYFSCLKFIPGLPLVFDNLLKIDTYITNPSLLDWMDEISAEVQQWPGVTSRMHKYGGIQFDLKHKEIGHIHSNGLLDMPFSRQMKAAILLEGRAEDHHFFKNTGWISFYIRTRQDMYYALQLLKLGYAWREKNNSTHVTHL